MLSVTRLSSYSKLAESINRSPLYIEDGAMTEQGALAKARILDQKFLIYRTGTLIRDVNPFAPVNLLWLLPLEPERAHEVKAQRGGAGLFLGSRVPWPNMLCGTVFHNASHHCKRTNVQHSMPWFDDWLQALYTYMAWYTAYRPAGYPLNPLGRDLLHLHAARPDLRDHRACHYDAQHQDAQHKRFRPLAQSMLLRPASCTW